MTRYIFWDFSFRGFCANARFALSCLILLTQTIGAKPLECSLTLRSAVLVRLDCKPRLHVLLDAKRVGLAKWLATKKEMKFFEVNQVAWIF